VSHTETNASEPLRKCRKRRDEVKTGGGVINPGAAQRRPAYRLSDSRHGGGVTVRQALGRNVGTGRLDAKGECQVVAPRGREYRGETQGRTTR